MAVGCNPKMWSIMKRYLYILLSAVVMFAACEPIIHTETKKDVSFYFGEVEVDAGTYGATITTVEPYMTIDGVKYEDVKIALRYGGYGMDTIEYIEEYAMQDGNIIFEINALSPNSNYYAYLIIDGGEYGKMESEKIEFTTQEYIPNAEITCDIDVEAKGLMATVNLTNVAYMVDGASAAISAIEVEYKRTSAEEWVGGDFSGGAINDGKLSVELPLEGEDYLEEGRNYHLRVTLYPESGEYDPITSDVVEFKTEYAEVTANIASPTLVLHGNYIDASVENIEVFYDGIPAEEYKDGTPIKYYFYYRVKNEERWTIIEAWETNGDISATIQAKEGNTYELMAVVVAGGMQKARESEVAEINVPKSDTPTPPVVGAGDTSEIAGTWQLTEWRGTEPSFDIYLDITADGVVTLWQRLESREWECYYSSADFVDGLLCGTYTDGVAWGASYSVTLGDDTMTWVDSNDTTDISVYTRAELPEDMSVVVTRAAESRTRFL